MLNGWTTLIQKMVNLAANARKLGLRETWQLYRYRIHERYHDWRLGIRTSGLIDPSELGGDADCQPYEAIHYRCLETIMDYFDPSPDRDVLLDYGSGMGRAVVVAARRPFRRVIGIELSEDLSAIARENLRRASRKLHCHDVQIITTDARDYEVPDDVTAVFLFNPFTGSVLEAVQDRIRQSVAEHPRFLRLVYMHPKYQENTFDRCEWLERDAVLPTADWDDVVMVGYRAIPERAATEPHTARAILCQNEQHYQF